jgi:hypothetical protein
MLAFATTTATKPEANLWLAALYAGVLTAIGAVLTVLFFQAEIPVLYILAFLLIGAGPVLGYQLAMGRIASDWKAIVGGILGFILLILGFLLWPILVGALDRTQSIGRLLLGSLIGIVLGIIVFLILASTIGQNPSWIGPGFVLLWAVWGATCGAIMVAWGKESAE